jgi:hypothetical protein
LTRLPPTHQRLIRLLMSDTCPSYLEVAEKLGLPVGSIARCGCARCASCAVRPSWPTAPGCITGDRLYHR